MSSNQPSQEPLPLWLAAHGSWNFLCHFSALVQQKSVVHSRSHGSYVTGEGSAVWGSRADVEKWFSEQASDDS